MLYRHREYPENASTAVWQFQEKMTTRLSTYLGGKDLLFFLVVHCDALGIETHVFLSFYELMIN